MSNISQFNLQLIFICVPLFEIQIFCKIRLTLIRVSIQLMIFRTSRVEGDKISTELLYRRRIQMVFYYIKEIPLVSVLDLLFRAIFSLYFPCVVLLFSGNLTFKLNTEDHHHHHHQTYRIKHYEFTYLLIRLK